VVSEEEGDSSTATEEPTIFVHALTGIQSWSRKTMLLLVMINGTHLRALLDSRSTHNFIDIAAA
jgi:hypothetical protein